jgi:hypothetical protein
MRNKQTSNSWDISPTVIWLAVCVFVGSFMNTSLAVGLNTDLLDDVTIIRPDVKTQFAHSGWNADRYPNDDTLQAHHKMLVGDFKGLGIIRWIHFTQHAPLELNCPKEQNVLFARGIVLEIWFDDAKEPAVMCPLADFFGDGCNAKSMDFSSKYIECSPVSYNSYFPMPFKTRARVYLRNDTDIPASNATMLEWETLPEWNESYGYFHATYSRKSFRLLEDTDETFFEIEGSGHMIGRQLSIFTDEPAFAGFGYVMESNNEIDIDGVERAVDYTGGECSFGFCWGYPRTFTSQYIGITHLQHTTPAQLSVYRFHNMPIRFNKSLKWHMNWSNERHFHGEINRKNPDSWWNTTHKKSRDAGGCWVDYAIVHYWYQDQPGGFTHKPLEPVSERIKDMLHPNPKERPDEKVEDTKEK